MAKLVRIHKKPTKQNKRPKQLLPEQKCILVLRVELGPWKVSTPPGQVTCRATYL